uniref:Uncharacterized protein n=3 Tax=Magallana gigas TaxID=29159 RepID=A0A8W8NRN5_MAGGI
MIRMLKLIVFSCLIANVLTVPHRKFILDKPITGNCHHGTACNGCNTADIIGHGFCCYNCYGAMKIDVTVDGVHCQC